ncbi:DinB family protein [Hymenobacter radiodurans]|uniref:DinB family protein n=1 Tax=Hymenobacter radiodurans TaxID=2496028 RepID=UPI001058F92E|nr:DinB family protein [Hymenobacter radiodurans]
MPSAVIRTTEFFDQLAATVQVVRGVVTQRLRHLSEDQLNRRPSPDTWSVGQCLEHLTIVGGHHLPAVVRKIKAASERSTKPAETVKSGFIGGRLVQAMRTPVSQKALKTPQRYAPSGSRLPRTVVEVFSRQLDEMLHLIDQARTINANRVRIPNPLIPLLQLRLTDEFAFLVAHIERHMAQVERVLQATKRPQDETETKPAE